MHIQSLTKQYGDKTVVDGVSFSIPKGKAPTVRASLL